MSTLSRKALSLLVLAGLSIALAVFVSDIPGANAQTDPAAPPSFTSPLELPTPESVSRSPQAEIALAYLSQQHAMPIKELQIVNEHERAYPLIGRTFKAFTIWTRDPDHLRDFRLLVDLDGQVEADVNAIIAQEEAAYRAKYGRLHPDLYERLQSVDADEMLPIAVWMSPDPKARTQAEIFADLAARYPGAAESLTEMGVPWAVEDPVLAEEIRQRYFRALSEDTLQRIQPLVRQLEELGFEAMTFEPVPSVAARLPKAAILTLAERDDAGLIYLLKGEIAPAMAEAAATNRMTAAWYQGNLSGAGRRIAVLEPTNIQNTGCLNVIATRTANNGAYDPNHKTHVASVLACNHPSHPNLRGIAYGAGLIDAAFNATQWDGYPDLSWALRWAIVEQPNNQNAEVINASFGYDTSQAMQWSDRVIDYWAKEGRVTIVVAAHNQGGNVRSPGKGWNIITVGALDDRGNSNWSDDIMWANSNWINPASTNGDHEKPEVVAPGVGITMVGPGGNPVNPPINGTSYAAPQVAGLAALLRNRNGALVNRPEAVKAIIMATAAHNVHGPRNMPSGQDLRDGAGAIDAALALSAAGVTGGTGNNNTTCNQPCWWATDTITVMPGTFITRNFRATRGERVRVAIAWWSDANWTGLSDVLRTNLNLQVMAPSGGQVTDGHSASWDNSNELVEFVAPETGIYTIRVIRAASDTSTESNEIGIAWTRTRTVYHDIWRGDQGWSRSIPTLEDQPQWGSATAWSGPWASTALPGSWTLQMQCDYVVGSVLRQNIWRGNQGWSRTVPIFNGAIQWGFASNWSGPFSITALPGSGALQAQSDYVINNTLHQNFWRGNQAWLRTVPIVNGVEQWANASAWSGPFAITALPGSGDMQMTADYVIDNSLHQEFWRGNQGYRRTVPIVGSTPQWNSASAWSTPLTTGSLAGSGSLQALNFYVLP